MRSAILLWVMLPVITLGCRSGGKTVDDVVGSDSGEADADTDVDADTDLVFTLDDDATRAGTAVGFTVEVVDDDGQSTAVSGAVIASDLEPDLNIGSAELTPILAGTHTLTASVTLDGMDMDAVATLQVSPAEAESLDLTLAAPEIVAGEALSFTLAGEDAYGNTVDTDAVTLAADGPDIAIDMDLGTVSTIVAGSYTLTAELDSQSDSEAWTVVPGPADMVAITLDPTELEAGDTANAEVLITDEYGNTIDGAWTITVDGTGSATVDGDEITFEEEGYFTVTVTVDGTAVEESVDLVIDSSGPQLIIDTPDRGSWTTETDVMVTGTVTDAVTGVTGLTIDGSEATIESDGDFSERVGLQFGINIIESIATDADTPDPNQTSDVRAVLQAEDWASPTDYMSEGIVIRLNEGDGGMDALSELAAEMIDPDTIASMMLGEVASGSVWWFSYTINVDSVDMGEMEVVLDTYEPHLRVTAILNDINVDGTIGGSFGSGFDLTADAIVVEVMLTPSVDWAGNIVATVASTNVTVSDMEFDADGGAGVLESLAGWFGVDVDGMIEDELTGAIETEIASAIPDMVEDAMSGIRVSQSMEIGDNTYTILAIPEDIDIDSVGMDIALKTQVTPTSTVADDWGVSPLGAGLGAFAYPSFAETSGGTELALGVDFFNQLMYSMWGGGLLDTAMTDEDLGIDVALIGLVLPGITDLTLVTTPTLPPVIIPHEDVDAGTDLAMQLGDLFIQIYNGPETTEALYMELYISAHVPLTLEATAEGDAIAIELGDPEIWVDVIAPDPSSPAAVGAESAFAVLVPAFLPEITGALGEIPIPAFAGFGMDGVTTALVGTDDGHLVISGDLVSE